MKTPILTYNDIKFYDLDEIPLYIDTLNDNYERKLLDNVLKQQLNENHELYEMAKNCAEFVRLCASMSCPIHYTIANIICLEDICPEMINHWRKELISFVTKIITNKTESSIKRTEIVIGQTISEYTESYRNGYTYLDALVYEDAMKEEIKKVSKSKDKEQQIVSKFIKSDILPYIDTFVEPNKNRVYDLFNGLIKACDKSNINIFKYALNEFVNYNNYIIYKY